MSSTFVAFGNRENANGKSNDQSTYFARNCVVRIDPTDCPIRMLIARDKTCCKLSRASIPIKLSTDVDVRSPKHSGLRTVESIRFERSRAVKQAAVIQLAGLCRTNLLRHLGNCNTVCVVSESRICICPVRSALICLRQRHRLRNCDARGGSARHWLSLGEPACSSFDPRKLQPQGH